MGYCKNCNKHMRTDYDGICSEQCDKEYQINSIALRFPCSCCGGVIIVKDGFYNKGKKVYCSIDCLINN